MPQMYNMNITHLLHRCYNVITKTPKTFVLSLVFCEMSRKNRSIGQIAWRKIKTE